MKLAGYLSDNPEIARVARMSTANKVVLDDVPVYCVFTPDVVELDFVGDRRVPQMRISGPIERVVPQVPLPYDVREVTFDPNDRPRLTGDYVFETEQIKALVDKGLYLQGFEPPRQLMMSVPWEFTVGAEVTVIAPDHPDSPPLVMLDLKDANRLMVDRSNSGYELAGMYPDYRARLVEEGLDKDLEKPGLAVAQAGEDLFADVDYDSDTLRQAESRSRDAHAGYVGGEEQARALSAVAEIRRLAGLSLSSEPLLAELRAFHEGDGVAGAGGRGRSSWERQVGEFYEAQIRDAGHRLEQEGQAEQTLADDVEEKDLMDMDLADFGEIIIEEPEAQEPELPVEEDDLFADLVEEEMAAEVVTGENAQGQTRQAADYASEQARKRRAREVRTARNAARLVATREQWAGQESSGSTGNTSSGDLELDDGPEM